MIYNAYKNFKVGDRVIVITEPGNIWTIVSMESVSLWYPIELSNRSLDTGICAAHEIRHVTPLEELL